MNIRVEWVTCRHFLLVSTWAGCQKRAQETEFVSNYSVKNVQLDLKSDRAVVIDLDKTIHYLNNILHLKAAHLFIIKYLGFQTLACKLSLDVKYHSFFLAAVLSFASVKTL